MHSLSRVDSICMTHLFATFNRLPERLCVGGGGTMPWASIRPDGKAMDPK